MYPQSKSQKHDTIADHGMLVDVKGMPYIGIGHHIRKDPLNYLSKLTNQPTPLIRFEHVGQSIYVANSPEVVEYVLQSGHKNFTKGAFYKKLQPMFGKGLPVLEGESWKRHRQLMQPAFRTNALKEIVSRSITGASEYIQQCHASSSSQPIDIEQGITHLTLSIVSRSLFGSDIDQYAQKLAESVDTLLAISEARIWAAPDVYWHWGAPHYWKFRQARRAMEEIIYEFVSKRKQKDTFGYDLLGLLLTAMSAEEDCSISYEELVDEIITLMITGHESTANTMIWLLCELARQPHIQEKLYCELQNVFVNGQVCAEAFDGLSYTKAVISEAMRMYPGAWAISRKNICDVTIHGVTIPAGSNFMVSPYLMQRNRHYYKNPEVFRPERFLNGEMEAQHPFIFFPFAAGPRRCIGEKFAWQEMLSIISVLCSSAHFELAPGQKIEPLARVAVKPAHGMHMMISKR